MRRERASPLVVGEVQGRVEGRRHASRRCFSPLRFHLGCEPVSLFAADRSGIVHQHVQAAPVPRHLVDREVDRRPVCYIALHSHPACEPLGDAASCVPVEIEDCYTGALGVEAPRDCRADT
jgi:hypothetical protein